MKVIKNVLIEFRIWFCNFIIAYIPFHFIRLGYYKYIMGFKIGKGSSIHLGCHFNTSGLFTMGINGTINQFCVIDNRGGIKLGDYVSISPKASLITADHDLEDPDFGGRVGLIIIKDNVYIGYNAIVLKGCILEKGSVIGASSLLTTSTEPYGIYLGIPAKFKKLRSVNLNSITNYKRLFH